MSFTTEEHRMGPVNDKERAIRYGKLQRAFLAALDELGPTYHKKIAQHIGIDWDNPGKLNSLYNASRKLKETDKILRIRGRASNPMYDFFEEVFPERGYLVLKPEQLEQVTRDMIDSVPETMTPSIRKSLDRQMDRFRHNGLPKEAYEKIVSSYNYKPSVPGIDMYLTKGVSKKDKKAKEKKRKPFYYHTATVSGMTVMFVPRSASYKSSPTSSPPDIWLRKDGLVRHTSLGKVMSDDGSMSDDQVSILYEALIKVGYNLPSEDEFTKAFSEELENYLNNI